MRLPARLPSRARRPALASLAALAALASLAACGPSAPGDDGGGPGINPHGSDGSFKFSWLINGQDPTAASDPCAAAHVALVRMVVVDDSGAMQDDSFAFDCHLGHYQSAQPELRAGTYSVYWEAVDRDGTRRSLASGTLDPSTGMVIPTPEMITIAHGTMWDFDAENRPDTSFPGAPTNFSTAEGPLAVQLSWAATAGAATGADCATAGVASFDYTLRLSNNVPVDAPAAHTTCSASPVQWAQLNADRYSLDVRGYDAAGTLTWSGHCTALLNAPGVPSTTYPCVVDRAH
jgi:hypothetical protein